MALGRRRPGAEPRRGTPFDLLVVGLGIAWLVSGEASLGKDLEPVRPLEDGPEQFARLAGGPPPEFKVFLAGEGREA